MRRADKLNTFMCRFPRSLGVSTSWSPEGLSRPVQGFLYLCIKSKVIKVKVTLLQALGLCTGRTAHRGSRGIALPFHDHGTRRGSASRPGRSLPPGKTRYPLYRRLCVPQGRSGDVCMYFPVIKYRLCPLPQLDTFCKTHTSLHVETTY